MGSLINRLGFGAYFGGGGIYRFMWTGVRASLISLINSLTWAAQTEVPYQKIASTIGNESYKFCDDKVELSKSSNTLEVI